MNIILNKKLNQRITLITLTVLLALVLCGAASADDYVGGQPLSTVQNGTVSGGLYTDTYHGFNNSATPKNVTYNFQALADNAQVTRATLYTGVYLGHMKNDYPVNMTVTFNGQLIASEYLSSTYTWPGEGGTGPVQVNDHANRVTSDYLLWYDVTPLMQQNNVVNVDASPSQDGRIKFISLIAAYNDGSSKKIHYWINQGHDTSTYYDDAYVGSTSFPGNNKPLTTAQLSVIHLSSQDGAYTFNGNTIPSGTPQGSFAGTNTWDISSTYRTTENNTLTYDRTGNFYKIVLATMTVQEAPQVDLTINGTVNPVPSTAVFAGQSNTVRITNIRNNGPDPAYNIVVALYASDVDNGLTPVNSTTIASLLAGAQTTIDLVDPTIRPVTAQTVYGAGNANISYTAVVDPYNDIVETNETNNSRSSTLKPVLYNGYKGKRYAYHGSDINTVRFYDLKGDIIYSTRPVSSYNGLGWTVDTETWNAGDLTLPVTATIKDVWLYVPYNWDTTPNGEPKWTITFNGGLINPVALYRDQSNFGGYPAHKYGLYVYNVTGLFNRGQTNTLNLTALTGNSQALYPPTLAVVYEDPNSSRKQIFINEEFDYLATSQSSYGTTLEEATAYANFSGLSINPGKVTNAKLHSFAASAGPNEGNLIFNGIMVKAQAWNGSGNTAYAEVFDVLNLVQASGNQAAIQGDQSGGMGAIMQFLVLEYQVEKPDLVVSNVSYNPSNAAGHQELFAHEPNNIRATIRNNGESDAGAFNVTLNIESYIETIRLTGLLAGEAVNVTFTGYTPTSIGSKNVQVSADSGNEIEESDENNSWTGTRTVFYNGYKGKTYTDGDNLETRVDYEGKYDLAYSAGNTAYNGVGWTAKTYTWTSSDLPIAPGANVVKALLYQAYTWNNATTNWSMSFNGNLVNPLRTYTDRKNYGTSNFPLGLWVYDVTSYFQTAGNTMTITPLTGNSNAIYGAYIILITENPQTSYKRIMINEECDMLQSRASWSVNSTESTAHINFNDVQTDYLARAKAIAILGSADEVNKSKFFFNNQEYTGFWSDYRTGPQIGFSVYDVTSKIQEGVNLASLQSFDPGNNGDYMLAFNGILILEYGNVKNLANHKLFGTIQDAIDDLETLNSHTLLVRTGNYQENVQVNKSLTLKADGKVILNPQDLAYPVIAVFDTGSGSRIEGFHLTGGAAGISLIGAENCILFNNTITGNDFGLNLSFSRNNTMNSNIIENNSFYGIFMDKSPMNTIQNSSIKNSSYAGIAIYYDSDQNQISNNSLSENGFGVYVAFSRKNNIQLNQVNENQFYGIYLENADQNQIIQNQIKKNPYSGIAIHFDSDENEIVQNSISENGFGINMDSSSENLIQLNQVNANQFYGIYLKKASENHIIENQINENPYAGIAVYDDSNYNELLRNFISANGFGLYISQSSENMIQANQVQANQFYGIYLEKAGANLIRSNRIKENPYAGIALDESDNNSLHNNDLDSNGWGVYVHGSNGNQVYYNNFKSNLEQNWDDTSNSWDDGVSSGNYYHDWSGSEPRRVPGGDNIDHYPQTNEFPL